MHPELTFYLRSMARLIYFVTDEEDRFLVELRDALKDKDKVSNVKVYNATVGLVPLVDLIDDWSTKTLRMDPDTASIQDALRVIYQDKADSHRKFYVLTDPERWLQDPQVQRRILNLMHQASNDDRTVKTLICVGSRRFIPEKLARYVEVITDNGLDADQIRALVTGTCSKLKDMVPPPEPEKLFKGMTTFEVKASIIQSFKKYHKMDEPFLRAYRFNQLKKTDLVQHVDVSSYSFDQIGGVGRFKKWALKQKAAWTPEGIAYGLKAPRGILAVGLWGSGKSLSVKCLGNALGLPVVQLEIGRLRSSGVGDTEANVYRATRIIEAMSPCLVWIDESEKSMAGSHSSSQTDGGTTSRSLGILSTWMQESQAPFCVAMTANSLKTLPPEFVNRMNQRWFFDLPSEGDRMEIIKIHLVKNGQDPDRFNLAELAGLAESLVGREIEQAVQEAMTNSFHAGHRGGLDEEIFAQELSQKPRIVRTMTDEIKETLDWVGYDPKIKDGVRARFAADPNGESLQFSIG